MIATVKGVMIGALAISPIVPETTVESTTAVRVSIGRTVFSYNVDKNNGVSLYPTAFDHVITFSTADKKHISKQNVLSFFKEQRSFTPEERAFYNSVNRRKMKKTDLNIFDLMKGKENVN